MESAKDVVFPSRNLKRQLQDAHMKLKEMEKELKTIKEKEQKEGKRRKIEVSITKDIFESSIMSFYRNWMKLALK